MGFEQRKKSGNIFAGSRLVVDGQGIYNVKILKFGPERQKSPLEFFRPIVVPKPIPAPLCDFNGIAFITPTPTPSITPTQTITPTPTPTNTPTPTSPLTCSASVVPPTTINGVVITDSSTGNVLTATSAYPSCGSSVTTPANSKWVGFGTPPNAVFTYTMNFSVPINNLIVFIAGAGSNAFPTQTENYIFTTNTGTGVPSITSSINCFTTIVNNQLFISYGTSTNGGGGKFLITNNVNFTSVTISGDGGLGGSFLSVCTNSILPPSSPTPTITPTPTVTPL